MKDATLTHHLERKVHNTYAACLNRLAPVVSLAENDLPAPKVLAEGGSETLECGLEDQFYQRAEPVKNTVQYDPIRSFNFGNVYVVGDQGFIYQGARRRIEVCGEVSRLRRDKARRPISWLGRRIKAPVFHLTGNNHESHGHFVLQHLPRLMAAREQLIRQPEVQVLLAAGHLHWQRFYLERLGFGPERLLEVTPGTLFSRQLEYIPFYFGPGNLVAAKTYMAMRDLLAPGPALKRNRYLFLSRKGATHRALVNETEVLNVCREVWPKMEPLDLKNYSPASQVDLFRSARVVVGPHGQAFTNLVYTHDTLALIFRPGLVVGGWSTSFRNLARQMGGEGLVLTAGIKGWSNKDNWIYDLKRLRGQLTRLQELLPDKYR